jgi:epsilon-lactone hydrolase
MPDIPLPLARAMLYPLFRYGMDSRVPWRVQRALLDAGAVVQTLPKGARVDRTRLGGRPAERVAAEASLVAPAAAAVRELAGFLGESLQPA